MRAFSPRDDTSPEHAAWARSVYKAVVRSVDELLACIQDPSQSVDARVAAGIELGHQGDPRIDSQPIDIPRGTLLQKRSIDSQARPIEIAAFAIAPHLVTVSEYAQFIVDGGYDDPAWWSEDGWAWRIDEDAESPRFYGETEWQAYLAPNQPIVGVSWFEADAYANYRGARLPSEDEWERCARANDGRDYPWGNRWNKEACGHRGYGPRHTSPIGVFPAGQSPFGLTDMVGNVWQWTEDQQGPPGDDGSPRIVRGGAWNNLPWSIGSAGRNAYKPTARFSNLGFRLAFKANTAP